MTRWKCLNCGNVSDNIYRVRNAQDESGDREYCSEDDHGWHTWMREDALEAVKGGDEC